MTTSFPIAAQQFCQQLNIRYPVIGGAMYPCSNPELTAAVSAAATYASSGVRVNAVAPGLVKTPMTSRIVENEVARKASLALHPLGRLGEPQDVASLIAWLLGPESAWVTGQVWAVDGGLSSLKGRPTL